METIDQIKIDEGGYQAEVYLCTEGKLTWLYGRNIEDRPINEAEFKVLKLFLESDLDQKYWADTLFKVEIKQIKEHFFENYHHGFFSVQPEEVQAILVNMAYNMGVTKFNPSRWPKFFDAIKLGCYKQAAIEGRDSRWFRQVGQRSVRLMNSLENVE